MPSHGNIVVVYAQPTQWHSKKGAQPRPWPQTANKWNC